MTCWEEMRQGSAQRSTWFGGPTLTAHSPPLDMLLCQSRPPHGAANTHKQASWGGINKGTVHRSVDRVRESNKGWCSTPDWVIGAAGTPSRADSCPQYTGEKTGVDSPNQVVQRLKEEKWQHLENWNYLSILLHHSHDLIFCLLFTHFFLSFGFCSDDYRQISFYCALLYIALCSAGDLVTADSVTQGQGMNGFWETTHKVCRRYMH